MRVAHDVQGPEHQRVHRLFTIRWTTGFVHTRLHATAADVGQAREQIRAWGELLAEIIPQLGGEFVTLIDTSSLGPIPRELLLDLVKLTRGMSRKPARRALIVAEGIPGDSQAETAQLVTAGNVRVFRPEQRNAALDWLAGSGIIDARRLQRFFD